ncbi:MAG TPA: phosphoribosylaminoimidazolesuccinocarboxamide synthase [Acidobacteriota bacterium]|nr:phosphoribosylaminoimidazolesuccinocarboxamide synthase [Acidobacteriota bacterium]
MTASSGVCIQTDLTGLKLSRRGKVRDVYEYGDNILLIATDRISAFDVVLPTPIPHKGAVLTQMSRFWFGLMSDIVPNHMISADVDSFPDDLEKHRDALRLRSMLVHKASMFSVECVARGYLAGSGWKEYSESGSVCGIQLPPGLRECDKLPEPIFTPATKAESGHDLNISYGDAAKIVGNEYAAKLRDLTLEIYRRASEYALPRGIIIADAKFEFGLHAGRVILCDEVLTPDSSRFWPRASYRPGRPQQSFDKQYVRDYLEKIHFNKQPPGPELPDSVVKGTSEKYLEAYRLLTGTPL